MKLRFSNKKDFLNTPFLVIVGFSLFILCIQTTSAHAHESKNESFVIVHVGDNGFEQKNIHINIDTQVLFENVGEEEHWPAGDDHPSHTLYDGTNLETHCAIGATPSFDSCKPLKPKETWSFIFLKAGVFKFHDHLWPQFTGEIVVTNDADTTLQKK